jgi:hypothetical protein
MAIEAVFIDSRSCVDVGTHVDENSCHVGVSVLGGHMKQ